MISETVLSGRLDMASLPAPLPAPDAPSSGVSVVQAIYAKHQLTGKMARFVEHYCRHRNGVQAYKHAYDAANMNYATISSEAHRLLRDERVAAALKERQRVATEVAGADVGWLLGRLLDIATADPRELIGLKVGCCRYCYGEGFQYQWREREYLEKLAEAERLQAEERNCGRSANAIAFPDPAGGFGFNATFPPRPDCPECHGEGLERFVPRDTDTLSDQAVLLYGGVKVKRDGYEIIIADQAKALEMAGRVMGAFNDKLKLSGAIGHMVAIADIRKVDPQEAARAYREFVSGHLATK